MQGMPNKITNQGIREAILYVRQCSMERRVGLDVVYVPPNEGVSKIVTMREYLNK